MMGQSQHSWWLREDRENRFRAALAAGDSIPKIMADFGAGVTRNMLIGKAYRIGLPISAKPRRVVPVPEPSVSASAVAATLALTGRQCRWPIGHPHKPDFHYCGAKICSHTSPYCAAHHARAYLKEKKTND